MKILKILTVLLMLSIITSCSSNNKNNNTQLIEKEDKRAPKIELIQIHFEPAFHNPLIVTYYISTMSVFLQPYIINNDLSKNLNIDTIELANFVPEPKYFKIGSEFFGYLRDSVIGNFSHEDFLSYEEDMEDGIQERIIFAFDNDSIVECNLINSRTNNQHHLITKIINICTEREKDSLHVKYLNILKSYYK